MARRVHPRPCNAGLRDRFVAGAAQRHRQPLPLNRAIAFPRAQLAETLPAAKALLGALLVRDDGTARRAGRIVEVEAYIGREDEACHARFGRTERNSVMFGPPGLAYVYLVYGMYHCLNVVTEPIEHPAAVLVRAVEPLEGEASMRAARLEQARRRRASVRRDREVQYLEHVPPERLAAGPGLVCAAFSIDRADNGADLCALGPLRLEPAEASPERIHDGPRVGIDYASEPWRSMPWRFWLDSPAISTLRKR